MYEKKQNGRQGTREHGGEVYVGSHAQKGLLGSHAQDSKRFIIDFVRNQSIMLFDNVDDIIID